MCEKSAKQKTALVHALINTLEIFWHYGQIIPLEDRKKLGELIGELVITPDRNRVEREIVELLAGHEAQIVFRSKHKEIPYQPLWSTKT